MQAQILPGSQFVLSAAVANSLVKALEKFDLPKLKVKWPNDIMSANLKIGGILIENVISEGKVAATVIGVGLNVNQEEFVGLPGAGSMNSVSGKYFDLDKVLDQLLEVLEESLYALNSRSSEAVLKEYKKHLFRMQIPSTFQLPDESYFTGMIADVTPAGKLLVKTEDELFQEYDLKEIRLCY